jgi:hypothetical protein
MSEKIIIEFDDEEEKKSTAENKNRGKDNEENRIVIDFNSEPEKEEKIIEVEEIEAGYEEKIRNSEVNSFYRGNPYLNNSYNTDLKFPEGIDKGFRKKFSIKLKDEFFNSVLENNRYIILASRTGNIYLTDRFTGKLKDKILLENESFEKTGLVFDNNIYLNSLKKIFRIRTNTEGMNFQEEIYCADKDYFVWSSLNRHKDLIIFSEYNIAGKKAFIRIIDTKNINPVYDFEFEVKKFLSDRICICDGCAYLLHDNSVLIYDLERMVAKEELLNIKTDENSFIFYLNYRIYITSHSNELFYIDMPPVNYRFKTTGIKNSYINSIGGFADNIFIGTLDGWKYYKSSGLQVYSHEDEYENKIECISKNILVISQSNKIIFCNLNRFQEAEGYVIASNEKNESVEIVSAVISNNDIFVLTANGILEVFTNDKLNIHI